MTEQLRTLHGALAVEVDLNRLPDDGSYYTGRWSREVAERLADLVAKDLAGWFPDIAQAGLVVTGVAHSFGSLMRPGLPAFNTQAALFAGGQPSSLTAEGFKPGRLAIGCDASGELPDERLKADGGFAPLLLLPWSLVGPVDVIGPLADDMESRLGELGAAQPPTLHPLEQALMLPVTHAGYLTLNDACALANLQYQQLGCEALWPLIDAAIFTPQRLCEERLYGQKALSLNGEVWLGFVTPAAFEGDLGRWADWLARLRQYQEGLRLHAIHHHVVPAQNLQAIGCAGPTRDERGWLATRNGELVDDLPATLRPVVDGRLGLVAALGDDQTLVFPLRPDVLLERLDGEPITLGSLGA